MTTEPGAGVDAQGRPVQDPTKNVLELVEAAIKRQDDLREQDSRHIREIVRLKAKHAKDLRKAEAKRIDAIRAVDVAAAETSRRESAAQATVLAAQVSAAAEAMRSQVAAAADAAAQSLATALRPLTEAIADLRKAQYEQQGQKAQVVETQAATGGSRQSIGLWVAVVLGSLGFLLSLYLASRPGG